MDYEKNDFRRRDFKEDCSNAISLSIGECEQYNFKYMSLDLVYLNVLKHTKDGSDFIKHFEIDLADLKDNVFKYLEATIPKLEPDETIQSTKDLNILLEASYKKRKFLEGASGIVSGMDIIFCLFESNFSTLFNSNSFIYNYFKEKNLNSDIVKEYIERKEPAASKTPAIQPNLVIEDKKERKASFLEMYAINLSEKAAKGELNKMIGREDIIESMVITLGQYKKNNPLLIGDFGVGKSAIVDGLVSAIHEKKKFINNRELPKELYDLKFYKLDTSAIIAGTKYRGDFELRLKGLIKEISDLDNVALVVDDIHEILGLGQTSGSLDAVSILKPALSSSEIKIIGCISNKAYRSGFEDSPLSKLFKPLRVEESNKEDTLKIIEGLKSQYEASHGVKFTLDDAKKIIEVTDKFLTNKPFPDKALDVLDMSLSYSKLIGETELSFVNVKDLISKAFNLPLNSLEDKSEMEILRNLNSNLKSNVFGQDEAIDNVCSAIITNRAQIMIKDKPIGSYLLAGPTGVGKTELAKQVAKELNVPFIRFDMSEYSDKSSVSKLIGSAPGYVGYESGGLLIEEIVKNPNSVLLLDEIEKASPDLFDIFLQVFDYAKIKDNKGRVADFKNVLIFLTTNLGHSEVSSAIGFSNSIKSVDNSKRLSHIKKSFRPEFIARLDEILIFNPLNEEISFKIIEKNLEQIKEAVKNKSMEVVFGSDIKDFILKNAFHKESGARNVEKFIEKGIIRKISEKIVFDPLLENEYFFASVKDNNFEIIKKTRKAKTKEVDKINLQELKPLIVDATPEDMVVKKPRAKRTTRKDGTLTVKKVKKES